MVVKDTAVGAGDLWFDSPTDQIEHSVVNGLPPLRRFGVAQTLSRGDELRHSLNDLA